MPRLAGFPPAGALGAGAEEWGAKPSPEPRFLILGSFPSAQSLERREYYGNPRNHFWGIAASCLGRPEPADYGEKLALLREGSVAIWDVYAACERRGSLDKDITRRAPNPVGEFIARHPGIMAVGLNGGAAASAFAASLRGAASSPRLVRSGDLCHWTPDFDPSRKILVARLPSTSPVPTAGFRSAADKLPLWKRFFTIQM